MAPVLSGLSPREQARGRSARHSGPTLSPAVVRGESVSSCSDGQLAAVSPFTTSPGVSHWRGYPPRWVARRSLGGGRSVTNGGTPVADFARAAGASSAAVRARFTLKPHKTGRRRAPGEEIMETTERYEHRTSRR